MKYCSRIVEQVSSRIHWAKMTSYVEQCQHGKTITFMLPMTFLFIFLSDSVTLSLCGCYSTSPYGKTNQTSSVISVPFLGVIHANFFFRFFIKQVLGREVRRIPLQVQIAWKSSVSRIFHTPPRVKLCILLSWIRLTQSQPISSKPYSSCPLTTFRPNIKSTGVYLSKVSEH